MGGGIGGQRGQVTVIRKRKENFGNSSGEGPEGGGFDVALSKGLNRASREIDAKRGVFENNR